MQDVHRYRQIVHCVSSFKAAEASVSAGYAPSKSICSLDTFSAKAEPLFRSDKYARKPVIPVRVARASCKLHPDI